MNKKLLTNIAMAILVIAVGVAAVLLSARSRQTSPSPSTTPAATVSAACQAFTLDDAAAILGPGTKVAPGNGGADSSSEASIISDCSYVAGGTDNSDPKSVSAALLIRTAETAEGADYNKSMFSTNRPTDTQDVPGIGDAAFWDAPVSQLNVLQGDKWCIISNLKGTQATSGTLDTAKAIYDLVKPKL